ncbi:probable carbohydrate esterase At4g34215 [Actinidia eriantha]|uniref:probable carbohydrate esterase At4g34215 n=1 Tax=Actinidia eriantha TaxID=165200 RepID=UPI002586449C|nr:probable carbohydrate esterase At4g34215 [Actinidia eriantha]
MRLTLLWLVLLAWACLVSPSEPTTPLQVLPDNIFILAGQSNMAGRGGVTHKMRDGTVPLECQPSPSILRLNADLAWEVAHEPLHADIDVNRTCGVGPGLAFANAVLDKEPGFGVVGLVPCAIGGTRIKEWARGSRLYNELVRRAETAREVDGGRIRAILWYQGESDTVSREDAELYKQRLEIFFSDLRADLQSPTLLIFQVALASGQGRYIEQVREAQLGVNLPNVITIDAKGLPLQPDGLHLTAEGAVRVGEMLANAFLKSISRSTQNNPTTKMLSYLICKFWMHIIFWFVLVILTVDRAFYRKVV